MGQFTQSIEKLYVAYFNRPADPAGLAYWEGVASSHGLAPISAAFAASDEYKSAFAGQSHRQIVDKVYQNLFNRPAEADGLNYWSQLLDQGRLGVDNVVTAVLQGAQGSDAQIVTAKLLGATEYTQVARAVQNLGVHADALSGSTALNAAKAFLASIDANTKWDSTSANGHLKVLQGLYTGLGLEHKLSLADLQHRLESVLDAAADHVRTELFKALIQGLNSLTEALIDVVIPVVVNAVTPLLAAAIASLPTAVAQPQSSIPDPAHNDQFGLPPGEPDPALNHQPIQLIGVDQGGLFSGF